MPGILDGHASGVKTNGIIDKLVKLEKRPIGRMKRRQGSLSNEIKALKILRQKTKILQNSLRTLYNFEAGFELKAVTTSPEGIVSGIANKNAEDGTYQLIVKQLASKLRISSNEQESSTKLPKSKVTINGKTFLFVGGNVKDLRNFLNKNYKKILSAKAIRTKPKTNLLVLESKIAGEAGILNISDSKGIFKQLGVINSNQKSEPNINKPNKDKNLGKQEDHQPLLFDSSRMFVTKEGPTQISTDQKSLTISGSAGRKLMVFIDTKKKLKAVSFNVQLLPKEETKTDIAPDRITIGPVKTLNIKGIKLDSYNVLRQRKKEQVKIDEKKYGIILHYANSKSITKDLTGKTSLVQFNITKSLEAIEFYTKNEKVIFANAQLVYEKEKSDKDKTNHKKSDKENKSIANQKKIFPNIINSAKNAIINLDGIDIERPKNTEIKDILDGVTLNLLKESTQPIKTTVTKNTSKAITQIEAFVKAYNDLLNFIDQAGSTQTSSQPGNYKKDRAKSGILAGNSTVRYLLNGLKRRVSNPYPATKDPKLKIFPMLGISTGKPGTAWKEISRGLLKIEKSKLNEVLTEHPESVKEFFGSDNDGDRRIDNGFAYITEHFLRPYTRGGRGIFNTSIKSNHEKISLLDKDIVKTEEHAERFKLKLKEKFGRMEGNVSKSKATGRYIRSKFGQKQ